jgi:wyosine [tRNA(Phe)-imidazoG37] synthetase (radical SAM superfamily)
MGIDLLSTKGKTCSFDCVYCQLGITVHPETERREFVALAQLTEELDSIRGIAADYVTFSGMGEPTLAGNLGEAIQLAKSILNLPVAVLTNSSLMSRQDVRQELAKADVVVAKLDAPNEELFQIVNRPMPDLSFSQVVAGISHFRKEYQGKLVIQMMFIKANKHQAKEMAKIARELSPDEIEINTPLRPCPVQPLPPPEIAAIQQEFASLKGVVTVYEAVKPEVVPLNLKETLQRRPKL